MIEATKSYKTGDGTVHATLEAAQAHELELLGFAEEGSGMIQGIVANKDAIIAILKLKPRKARNGKAKKAKAPKVVAAA